MQHAEGITPVGHRPESGASATLTRRALIQPLIGDSALKYLVAACTLALLILSISLTQGSEPALLRSMNAKAGGAAATSTAVIECAAHLPASRLKYAQCLVARVGKKAAIEILKALGLEWIVREYLRDEKGPIDSTEPVASKV